MSGFLQPRRFGVKEGEAPGLAQAEYKDESFAKKYPVLAEFLQREYWDDGKPRTRASMVLFCEEGGFKACLNDKDAECVAFVTKHAFLALLDAVEKGLKENTLDWRLTLKGKQLRRK